MRDTVTHHKRPLSPHISIYRWQVTMVMSIAHRITGVALYFGTILLVIWLIAIASGERAFHYINTLYTSLPGRAILFLYTLALTHHLVGGIRHLLGDVKPTLLERKCASKIALATIFISVILTLSIWTAIFVLTSR